MKWKDQLENRTHLRFGWFKTLGSRNFFISYLFVALTVLLITNLFFYLLFVPRYQREVERINTGIVEGIQGTFDHEVRQKIEKMYFDLVLEGEDYGVLYPLINAHHDDLWKLYQANQYMKAMADDTGELLTEVGVYYPQARFINSSLGFFDETDVADLNYPAWMYLLDDPNSSAWRAHVEEKRYLVNSPTKSRVIYHFMRFPLAVAPGKEKMTIVFTLSEAHLKEALTRQIVSEEYALTLMTTSGELLCSTQDAPIPFASLPEDIRLGREPEVRAFQHDGQMVTVLPDGNDLLFIFSVPRRHYFHQTDQIKIQLLILASVTLLWALISSKLISKRMYSPIADITATANQALTTLGQDVNARNSGYASIHDALELLTGRVQDLSGLVEANWPRLRTNFYRDLLFADRMGGGSVEERMASLGIAPTPYYRVFILRINETNQDASYTELLKIHLLEYLRAQSTPERDVFATVHGEDHLIAVASYAEEAEFERLVASIEGQLWGQENTGADVLFAIGSVQEDILELRTSLREARTTLNYGWFCPQRILRYEEVEANEASQATLACAHQDRLFELVNDLSTPNAASHAEAYIRALHEEIAAQRFSYRYLRFTLLGILVQAISIVRKRGVFIDALYEKDLLERHEQIENLAAYEQELARVLAELTARMQLKRNNANYDIIATVQQYVQEHLGEELSLKLVSERFHVSYSHMSKIFKEISGMNFTEYVLQCRLEKSIHLLLDTNLNLDAIAERVAIYNTGYYIRAFKAKYGVTPKQYRLSHTSE